MNDPKGTPRVVIHYDEPAVNPAARPFPIIIPSENDDDTHGAGTAVETPAETATGPATDEVSEAAPEIVQETASPDAGAPETTILPVEAEPAQPAVVPTGPAKDAHDDPAGILPTARFAAIRAGEEGCDLIVLDGDGEPRQLTTGGRCVAARPLLSPDGRRIAFLARDGTLRVYDLNRDEEQEVAEAGPFTAFNWSRDGSHIAMDGLRVVSLAAGEVIPVDHPGSWPVWLPDGRHLLAAWEHKLWVVDWTAGDGAPVEDMLLEPRRDLQVSRDGRYAAYVSPSGSAAAVRVVDLLTQEGSQSVAAA